MAKRTDMHRPGAIIPADYSLTRFYAIPGENDGPFERADFAATVDFARERAQVGSFGKCGVCGAAFRYGALFTHTGGELIHMGQDCARKYEMLGDYEAWDAHIESVKRARAAMVQAALNRTKREAFLAANPGLAEALQADHHISADLRNKFQAYCSLSPKQVELAFKLQAQANEPPKAVEPTVQAPEGRMVVRGIVLSVKSYDSDWGQTWKMAVKVQTPTGYWIAWGTVPSSLPGDLKGKEVEFTATLSRGNEAHFALCKRPSKAKLVA